MLRVIAVFGASTYYLASEPLDYDNKYWEPRIANTFQLNRQFEISEKTGNRIRSMELTLDNRGQYFNAIEATSGFLNMKVTFLFKEGTQNYQKFTGRVNKVNSFGDEISLSIMESGYEYLKSRIPDAQIAYDYYSTNGLNESWNAIPIPFGTVDRIPLSWVNLFRSEFIIGSGPLYLIRKLYFDKTLVYDVSTGKNGYKPTPESEEIKFRVFHGTGSVVSPEVVGGVTSEYPGFAYIQLYKLVGGVEEPADPVTPDGEVTQIYADIYGIRNAGNSDAERNPAQILYNLMTKPTTGYEGYGLGLSTSDLDFADAILECTVQGFKIDGVIDNTAEFGEWLNEILRCCRGNVIEEDGKIKLTIDAAKTASGLHFDETGADGFHCDIDPWEEPDIDSQTNRVRLSYSWNFERGDFNKKPSVHEESPILDPNLKDTTHAARILKWNTETLEFKLIRDDTTAHKLAQYYLKNITKQLKRTSLVTEVSIGDLDAGEVITVTSPKYGWVEKEFLVTGIKRSQEQTNIEIKEYSDDVYVFTDPGTGAEDSGSQYSAYNVPAKPTMTSLTVVNEKLTDGTVQTRLDAVFVKPATNVYLVALYYKPVGDPDTSFRPLDFTVDATRISAIWKGIETGNYNFRLVSVSPVGIYSDIAIEAGDKHYFGQPGAESYKTLTGDTVAPGTPAISDINPILGGVSFYMTISGGIPDDFSHFKIYRKIGIAAETLLDEKYASQLFSDIDRGSGYDARTYAAIAVDKSGNESALSSWSASTVPLRVNTADIEAASVTTDKLTAQQIIAKDFRTACNAGNGVVSGVILNANGFQAWNGACRTVNISNTGDVEIAGTITATSGVIGGWCAASCCLYSGNLILHGGSGYIAGCYAAGSTGFCLGAAGNAEFNCVTVRGTVCACAGCIAGFTITNACGIYSGTGATRVQMKSGTGLWLGADDFASAPFSVTPAGALTATSATICGTIYSCAGNIGGWCIANGCLYSTTCGILLTASGSIQTGDFVTSNKGWKIDSIGNAEFNNICARGAIRTAVFIKDEITVVGGCMMIRPATVLSADDNYSASSNIYYVDDNTQFAVNDLIRIKSDTCDFWGKITASATGCITVGYCNGCTSGNITKGQAIVNYGSCLGCGGIVLNGQCPYIDLYTHAGLPWNGTDSRVRLGNLAGWGTFSTLVPTYGIAMGCPTGQYLTYDSVSGVLDIAGNINVKSTLPLSMPAGAVGEWVVRGSNTASIAALNGVIDISGNSSHGQAFGVDVTSTSKGYAFCFNGSSDYIKFLNAAWNRPSLLTLDFCAYQADWTVAAKYISKTENGGFNFSNNNEIVGEISVYVYDGATYRVASFSNTLLTAGWHRLSATYDGYVIKIYADGNLMASSTPAAYAVIGYTVAADMYFGAEANGIVGASGPFFNGYMFDISMFNRALSAEEIKTLHLVGKESESGTITAERVKTGVLSSLNYGASAGSCISMNDGTFKFGGSSAPKLAWDGTTLCVNGCVTACCGTIGSWCIANGNITQANAARTLLLNAVVNSIQTFVTANPEYGEWHGRIYNNGGQTDRYGFAVTRGAGVYVFRSDTDINGNNACNQIAGWCFDCRMLKTGTFQAGVSFIISKENAGSGNFYLGAQLLQGYSMIWHYGNNAGHLVMGQIAANPTTIKSGYYGLQMMDHSGHEFFALAAKQGLNCYETYNRIAGWAFNSACLSSGNLILNSAGSISGCYNGTTTGWCINAAGNAVFNNATVRGTVCSCVGVIGGFILGAASIGAEWSMLGSGCCYTTKLLAADQASLYLGCAYSGNCTFIRLTGSYNGNTKIDAPVKIWVPASGCYALCTNGAALFGGCLCSCSYMYVDGFIYSSTCISSSTIYSSGKMVASRLGYVGTYNSAQTQGVWSMGTSYMPTDASGTNFGTLYGMGYSYGTVGGGYFASHHQIHWVLNGEVNASMSMSGYLWVRNYIITACGLASTCLCSPIVCATTGIYTPFISMTDGTCQTAVMAYSYLYQCYTGRSCVIICAAVTGSAIGTSPLVSSVGSTSYVGMYTNGRVYASGFCVNSDRNLKTDFQDINVLSCLRQLDMVKWRFKDSQDYQIGPMAQDFNNVFRLSSNWSTNLTIGGLDGIALKAAKEIDENVQVHVECISKLEKKNIDMFVCVETLSSKLKAIEEHLGIN